MEIGGGIISKNILFVALLLASIFIGGMATASAAEVGATQIHTSDSHTLNKYKNTHSKSVYDLKDSTKKQTKVDRSVKWVKHTINTKQTTSKAKNTYTEKLANIQHKSVNIQNSKSIIVRDHIQKQDQKQDNIQKSEVNYVKKSVCNAFITSKIHENTSKVSTQITVNPTATVENATTAAAYSNFKTTTTATQSTVKPTTATATSTLPANLKPYIASTANCQVTNAQINALAWSLAHGSKDVNAATNIFNWVRDHLSYSFYYNTKYGAVGTLNAGTGNCVDTTHLVVALCRAAGIPACYQHVYAQFSSGNWYGHVVAQIWVNGVWYIADASSNYNTFGVINNWNRGTATNYGTYASLPF
ncbi:MAG: transglutaminase-like domain-containing protein [Methanobacterium sp.]